MRLTVFLLLFLLFSPLNSEAVEISRNGAFSVRKIDAPGDRGKKQSVCKLDISMTLADRESGKSKKGSSGSVAVLSLYPNDDFHSELFTLRDPVGLARNKVKIQFDEDRAETFEFLPDEARKDEYWRWQYLRDARDLLDKVANKNLMRISFSNGREWWRFKLPLRGTHRMVKKLKQCR
ncbi:hypothetical protein ACQZV8_02775 [Magnetococcales bacterium HHB-1]